MTRETVAPTRAEVAQLPGGGAPAAGAARSERVPLRGATHEERAMTATVGALAVLETADQGMGAVHRAAVASGETMATDGEPATRVGAMTVGAAATDRGVETTAAATAAAPGVRDPPVVAMEPTAILATEEHDVLVRRARAARASVRAADVRVVAVGERAVEATALATAVDVARTLVRGAIVRTVAPTGRVANDSRHPSRSSRSEARPDCVPATTPLPSRGSRRSGPMRARSARRPRAPSTARRVRPRDAASRRRATGP